MTVEIQVAREIGCSSSPACAVAAMFSARMPIRSDSPSATTPRTTGQRSQRWRLRTETSGKLRTSIAPSSSSGDVDAPAADDLPVGGQADGDRPRADAAHHDALEDGLAADGQVVVRRQCGQPLCVRSGCQVGPTLLAVASLRGA